MKHFAIVLSLLGTAVSIGLPLTGTQPRCMIAYTDDAYETLKLDVSFPELPGQVNGEVYQISLYNTETNEVKSDSIANGKYLRELTLDEDHVYRICFRILSNRGQLGTTIIDYNSDIEYKYEVSDIKVPENLLKDQDTREAYLMAEKMEMDLLRYSQFKERRKEHQNEHFELVVGASDRLGIISVVELAVIACVGVYQFFMIRKFLLEKHM